MRPSAYTDPAEHGCGPYVGRRPFESTDRGTFFGRAPETAELALLWQSRPVTVLHGPSGVGKTSLLNAGLYPNVNSGADDRFATGRVINFSSAPQASLPPHNPYTVALLSSWCPAEPVTALAGLTISQFLRRRLPRTDRFGRALPVLAPIDQAEDLFLGDPRYCQALMEELREAVDDHANLRLLVVIRDDHLNDLTRYNYILGINDAMFLPLKPLAPGEAITAVCRPAESAGRPFTPGAAEAMINDLRLIPDTAENDPFAPVDPALLQITSSAIWESATAEQQPQITADDVRSSTGVSKVLTDFVSAVITETAEEYGLTAQDLHSWASATFDVGISVTEDDTQTAGMPNSVVQALQDKHLLKAEWGTGTRRFRLQHDRLVGPLRDADFRQAARLTPNASLVAARRAVHEGDYTRVERNARRIISSEPTSDFRLRGAAESLIGDIGYAQGMPEAAEEHYRTAAMLFEAVQDTAMVGLLLTAIGRIGAVRGRHLEAMDAIQAAVERSPADPGIQAALAETLWESGKSRPAVSVLDQVLIARGDMPDARRLRAEILAAQGDAEGARRDRNLANTGLAPRIRAARAVALAAAREFSAARREIGTALEDASDDGSVLLYAAQVRNLLGDNVAAADLVRRAISAQHPPLRGQEREQARLMPLNEA